jgi:cysteine dioxygenase
MIGVEEFALGLTEIPDNEFTYPNVLNYLSTRIVDIKSLSPYLYFSAEHYTRNLIHKTEIFELIALCWDIGQKSPIHNHRDQKCWMAMPYGKLQIHNFEMIRKDSTNRFCELKSAGQILMDRDHPQNVDPEDPIHQVLNLASFNCRAVSLHIYSRPYDTCEVYDLKMKSYQDVPLFNTSEFGKLLNPGDSSIERFSL